MKKRPLTPRAKAVLVAIVKQQTVDEILLSSGDSWALLNSTLGHLETRGLITRPGKKLHPTVWGVRVSGVQK